MKNRKIWLLFLLFSAFLLSLTSCAGKRKTAVEPEETYLVASVGIDSAAEGVTVSLEIPMIREKDPGNIEKRIFSFSAPTAFEALETAKTELSKKVIFDHCALVAFGQDLEDRTVEEILKEFGKGGELPLSAQAIQTENARKLLSSQSLSALTVGYEIAGTLQAKATERNLKIRIYELAQSGKISLPVVSLREGESGERFWLQPTENAGPSGTESGQGGEQK